MIFAQISKPALAAIASLVLAQGAFAQTWEPVTDPDHLREIFSDTVFEAALTDKAVATARYNADGTGEMTAWGVTHLRTWKSRITRFALRLTRRSSASRSSRTLTNLN